MLTTESRQTLRLLPVRRPPVRLPPLKTRGELEAAICDGIHRFEQECIGRNAGNIRTHLLGDVLLVRLAGELTPAEKHLARSGPSATGRNLIKEIRTRLVETARPVLDAMIEEVTGVKVMSVHQDISTVTGEEVFVAILERAPLCRESDGPSPGRM